ncbi:iron-containing alcohol dehydrogenase [Streptomyces sp. MB09-02B]|nr:iron-containing alcohol dehydrogenase [Streptomyces sp. MB09-02B]MDX3641136.1 iron-containing alcohol dehydrogenase [Streptomyces sp. MB09-02B]
MPPLSRRAAEARNCCARGVDVHPFAVISDPATGKKYPLADYALTPSVAIVDPLLIGWDDSPPSGTAGGA